MSGAGRVLVVDDEPVVLESVRIHLRKEGYEIETALSAPEALQALDHGGADVVVTDLMMPGMDGLELLSRIHETRGPVPVIMITGYATMRTALQALRRGAFDYIAKPFTRAEIQGVVARAMRQVARGVGAEGAAPTRDSAGPETLGRIGGHCWVARLEDGSVRIGLERQFAETVGEVEEIETPAPGDYVEQGSVCLRFLTRDGKTHTLWSPLSGSVIELNPGLDEDPALAIRAPYEEGWLLRLQPGNLEEELRGLQV